ncbi:MAG: head-tail connector protein [Roseovarius sp.]|uniref:head-tail connector protein n=1 Tax=Roseovarius sp. TaxID=1486281 RepID=UPI00405939BE
MKMTVSRTPISAGDPFTLSHVQTGLRVEAGDMADEVNRIAWAAAREVEHFAQIALLKHTIRVMIFDPVFQSYMRLPIGPVAADHMPTVTFDGEPYTEFLFDGGDRPCIRWSGTIFDQVPSRMVIEYEAGFGDTASDIPADLAQAVIDQAALMFDGRSPMDGRSLTSSPHVARIGARYRGVSL